MYCYQPAGHIVTVDLKIITDSRIQSIICKGPKYRFPVPIDFKSCREEIAGALQEFCMMLWLFVGPTGVYLLDFFCSGIQFNLLLSPYPCFISLLYLDLYVLGDDALIS